VLSTHKLLSRDLLQIN